MGVALGEQVELFGARSVIGPAGLDDGPDLVLGQAHCEPMGHSLAFEELHAEASRGPVASPGLSTGSPALLCSPSDNVHSVPQDPTTSTNDPARLSPGPTPAPDEEAILNSPGVLHGASTSAGLSTPATAAVGAPAADIEPASPVANFITALRKPLNNPVLATAPVARPRPQRLRVTVPRRSTRLAAKSACRDPVPERQARRVLLSKWSRRPSNPRSSPDDAIATRFRETFKEPVSSSKKAAMRELFRGRRLRRRSATPPSQ